MTAVRRGIRVYSHGLFPDFARQGTVIETGSVAHRILWDGQTEPSLAMVRNVKPVKDHRTCECGGCEGHKRPVRVPARMITYLEESQLGTELKAGTEPFEWDWIIPVIRTIWKTDRRADGSVLVRLGSLELRALRDWAEFLEAAARDDAGWDPDARADLNAARAVIRAAKKALARLGAT